MWLPSFQDKLLYWVVFFCIQVSLGIEEQTEFHKLQFCPESHGAWNTDILNVAYSDNLPVFPKAQVDNQLDFVVQWCLVISLIHSTQNFEVWFDALVEEQQVRAIIMASPLLSSGLRLTYLLSLLNSIRFLSYQLREFVSKLTLVCLILPNCSFVVK